ncbi:hypothetical protein [Nocardia asteroides]|nr:hypothetical protein [Nocardia asteroides]TLF68966.1 hypothetical protein FEK33_01085 [Nocardia asteroides NBRC 15531]UGT48435.1 hypothetical protein LT345_28910 [Nocardia asteroides]SFL59588.1 hypothetical protein SAMN05444423_101219 [Nocardia asteroides]VEG32271.1 Uncharacterised protein [Nocardia asteroides]
MRTLGLIAACVAVTTASLVGAGPARADFTDPVEYTDSGENTEEGEFGEYAVERNAPGSCLVVQNHTGGRVTLRLNYPTSKGKWTFGHDEVGVLVRDGRVVTSPSGRWSVRTNPPIRFHWVYDNALNNRKGCNGSWVLTMN